MKKKLIFQIKANTDGTITIITSKKSYIVLGDRSKDRIENELADLCDIQREKIDISNIYRLVKRGHLITLFEYNNLIYMRISYGQANMLLNFEKSNDFIKILAQAENQIENFNKPEQSPDL